MVIRPLAIPNITMNPAATSADTPSKRDQRERREQDPDREPRDHERMNAARKRQLANARQHLRRPEQRTDRDHGRGIDAGASEDREQMRRQAGRHEGIGRERGRDHDERPTARRQQRRRRHRRCRGRDRRFGARTRQRQREQRRRDAHQHRGKDQVGAAPADALDQEIGRRPAHGRGEAAGQRERRDRRARAGAEDTAERGEGRIVERRRDGGAEQHPDAEIGDGMFGIHQADQTERGQQRADRHHPMAAIAIDHAADGGRDDAADQQRQRDAGHGERQRPAALRCDQRDREHRRIEQRPPGDDLGHAEHEDGAPGTRDDGVKARHAGTVARKERNPSTARCAQRAVSSSSFWSARRRRPPTGAQRT